jgi:dTDP-4-dehydrorhamnose 3,5-epimerase
MKFRPLGIDGAFEIELAPRRDERGYFARTFDDRAFADHGLATEWVQDNESHSLVRGTVRGLHFQRPPHAENKFVRVVRGAILDVFVDLRRSSSTYGRHDMVELSFDKHNAVHVPRGCAHGFCTLADDTIVLYKVDAPYAPEAEGGLLWNDPGLDIAWPSFATILSPRDAALPGWRGFVSPFQ